MTDAPDTPPQPTADRIAKVMARAGVASRREAERMILEGRVAVNGKTIDSPALDVQPGDRITVDGKKLDDPQETRLWLYYKPVGLVTSDSDEKGRQTVFDALPRDLPRVMTIGRLDLTSEGLLLLTNDGELKRRLELPSTGWLRRYRVRVNGTPNDMTFAPLRRGVTIEGEDFAPMEIKLDSQQGANAWITVGIREGKNREIRRAMAHIGLQVNRLIRIGYGPFKLTGMEKNEVVEVKRRVLRDQLGGLLTGEETAPKDREMRPRGAEGARKPRRDEAEAPRRSFRSSAPGADGEARLSRKPATRRDEGDRSARPSSDRPFKPRFAKTEGERPRYAGKSGAPREDGERPARPSSDRPFKPRFAKAEGERPRYAGKSGAPREEGDRPARPSSDRPFKPRFAKAEGERPRYAGKSGAAREDGDRPARSWTSKPRDNAEATGDRPRAARLPREGQADAGRRDGPKPAYRARSEGRGADDRGFAPRGDKPAGGRVYAPRGGGEPAGSGPRGAGKPAGEGGFKPRGAGKPAGEGGFKPRGEGKPGSFGARRPGSDGGFKPRGEGQPGGKGYGKPGGAKPARGGAGDTPRGRPGGKPGGRPGGKPRA